MIRYKRKTYWNKPKMNFWERLYIFEIVRGLYVTFSVFAGNMFKWFTFRKGALTAYYPEEIRKDYAKANRGRHILTQRPNGEPQCIACNMCATVCPAICIEIEAGFNPNDPYHPKYPTRFEIDMSRCIFCGFCVEACPEDAIRMVQYTNDIISKDRNNMWIKKEELLTWHPQSDVRKPYPVPEKEKK